MKRYHVFKGIIVLGTLLLIQGVIFAFWDWVDGLYGMYSGPALIVLGIVLHLVTENKEVKNSNQNLLSSRATFIYKFVLPFLTGVALIIYFAVVLINNLILEFYIPVGLFLVFLWGMLFIAGIFINNVYYNSEAFFIKK